MTIATLPPDVARQRQNGLDRLLRLAKMIPVITIEDADHAVPLARALVAGGLRLIEITLRTPAAMAAAKRIIQDVPEAVVGIGTALSGDDLRGAIDMGAQFAFSPGITPALLEAAAGTPLPFVPGIATPSELMLGLEFGFTTFKFFPAVPSGGIAALRSLSQPFPNVRFCPTGGINGDNAADWLELPNVVAVGGSWLTPMGAIRSGNWETITQRAAAVVTKLEDVR